MNRSYQHLFFDLDRTIWDFETNAKEAIADIHTHFNLKSRDITLENFHITYKKINEQLWEKYRNGLITKEKLTTERFYKTFKTLGFDSQQQGKAAGQLYLELSAQKTHLFPHTHETLSYLNKKYELHIITNGFKEVQTGKLRNCNIGQYFNHLITSEDVGFQKPDVRIFEYALQTADTNSEKSLMIGDDEKTDILGASKAGMNYIWFNPGRRDSLFNSRPAIYSLKELIEIL
ncbi:YjjG family noncanonical pyrimidine nucleotidase [Salinivirga cyanobacteriivorans]